eukprot:CAMPEP_0114303386 /NCGR_PEP_ID=MMETSP0059-20121206/15185_1 /TAXON_ID=36894 /ORGANISM="Pyramimonas parkeae, Strain CCMP726" /LENGTH=351 /DNA_ID=CAMNT_0001426333 /DNA_START=670 /DNA_END=1725 /DNA_ORIENTATION=-
MHIPTDSPQSSQCVKRKWPSECPPRARKAIVAARRRVSSPRRRLVLDPTTGVSHPGSGSAFHSVNNNNNNGINRSDSVNQHIPENVEDSVDSCVAALARAPSLRGVPCLGSERKGQRKRLPRSWPETPRILGCESDSDCEEAAPPPAPPPIAREKDDDVPPADATPPRKSLTGPSSSKPWMVYILCSEGGEGSATYTGATTDVGRRLRQHNREIKGGARATANAARRPWAVVVVVHGFASKVECLQFEWAVKHVGYRKRAPGSGLQGRLKNLARVLRLERWVAKAPPATTRPLVLEWHNVPAATKAVKWKPCDADQGLPCYLQDVPDHVTQRLPSTKNDSDIAVLASPDRP